MAELPIGFICVWPGTATIPTNWQECDGTNGTPDLRGRVPACAGTAMAVGASGEGAGGFTQDPHVHTAQSPTGAAFDRSAGYRNGHGHSGTIVLATVNSGAAAWGAGLPNSMGRALDHSHTWTWDASAGFGWETNAQGEHVYHAHGVSGASDAVGASGMASHLPPVYAGRYIQRMA